MRNFVITVNGTQYAVAVEEVAAGAAPVVAAPAPVITGDLKASPRAKNLAKALLPVWSPKLVPRPRQMTKGL